MEKTSECFTSDQWFRTGDVGSYDDEGYYTFKGRMSVDIIKSGGEKLSAIEIERIMLENADIVDVAVVGIKDAEWDEKVVAYVVSKSQSEHQLRKWCKVNMAPFMVPKIFRFVEKLERNHLGKLNKKALIT